MSTEPTRPLGVTCESELLAMARVEANLMVRRGRGGVPEPDIVAAIEQERAEFSVAARVWRLFGEWGTGRDGTSGSTPIGR